MVYGGSLVLVNDVKTRDFGIVFNRGCNVTDQSTSCIFLRTHSSFELEFLSLWQFQKVQQSYGHKHPSQGVCHLLFPH